MREHDSEVSRSREITTRESSKFNLKFATCRLSAGGTGCAAPRAETRRTASSRNEHRSHSWHSVTHRRRRRRRAHGVRKSSLRPALRRRRRRRAHVAPAGRLFRTVWMQRGRLKRWASRQAKALRFFRFFSGALRPERSRRLPTWVGPGIPVRRTALVLFLSISQQMILHVTRTYT